VKVLVATAMYPTPGRPAFGSFVRTQVESLKGIGVDADPFVLEGRSRKIMHLRGIPRLRRRLNSGDVDVVHAHYSYVGAVARAQWTGPVVLTFRGDDLLGTIGPNDRQTLFSRGVVAAGKVLARSIDAIVVQNQTMAAALHSRPMRTNGRDQVRHLDGPLVAARLRDLYDDVLERCRRHPREARAAW